MLKREDNSLVGVNMKLLFTDDRDYSMPEFHYHSNHYEILCLLEGRRKLTFNNNEFIINEGDIAIIKNGDAHKTESLPQTSYYKRFFIYLTKAYINNMGISGQAIDKCFDSSKIISATAEMKHVLSKLLFEYENFNLHSPILMNHFVCEFIILLYRTFFPKFPVVSIVSGSSNPLIEKAVQYINKHYDEKITLTELAVYCHVNKDYLSRLFSKVLDTTIVQYINTVRIYHACTLLTSTSQSITDVGFLCGFNSTKHFSHIFKEIMGVTASHFKNNIVNWTEATSTESFNTRSGYYSS